MLCTYLFSKLDFKNLKVFFILCYLFICSVRVILCDETKVNPLIIKVIIFQRPLSLHTALQPEDHGRMIIMSW